MYPRRTKQVSSPRPSRKRSCLRPYFLKKLDRVMKPMAAKPDWGSWTSLLKEMGSSDGDLREKAARMGTRMVRKMKVR